MICVEKVAAMLGFDSLLENVKARMLHDRVQIKILINEFDF